MRRWWPAAAAVLVVVALFVGRSWWNTETVAVELGRVDGIGSDLFFDTRAGEGPGGRAFEACRFVSGWARSAPTGRWSVGRRAEIELSAAPEARWFWLEARPDPVLPLPLEVTVVADGTTAGTISMEARRFTWYGIDLGPGPAERPRSIGLEFAAVRTPELAGDRRDHRPLAILVPRLAVTRSSEPPPEDAWSPMILVEDGDRRVSRAGRFWFNLPDLERLRHIEVDVRAPAGAEGPRAVLALQHPGGDERLDPRGVQWGPDGAGSVRLHARGRSGRLQIVADIDDAGLVIGEVRARARPRALPEQDPAPVVSIPSARPDIVVIVLDATRADHGGRTYGYHRDTMPNLDQFADDAVVFRQVLAQAPYTSCSVPTMFTGLGWESHQVVGDKDRLPDGEVTLAEALQEAGYRTIGITATPNNSRRNGMEQGFDEFVRLWEGRTWLESIDPMLAANELNRRFEPDRSNGPLFLMLHLVPPHAPYTPPPAFRRWSDPDYDGPCDGTDRYLYSVRQRQDSITEADLNELVALYDGNLRYADAAFGRIVETLRRHQRLDNAVVVVTSDHGEAFLEHGHLDHNSTVYDEMLRVPLMIRLPQGHREPAVAPDRLASLEDLTPTLLNLAGVPVPPRVTGINLFGGSKRGEILHRTTSAKRQFAIRTDRWKLIADRDGRLTELYDLGADEGERNNLIFDRPGVVSWLADRWERALAAAPKPMETGQGVTTDEERALLRRLGYIVD